MITLEQAEALKDGDVVWSVHTGIRGNYYVKWTVYTPNNREYWPDERIIKYLKGDVLKSYLFNDRLHSFYLDKEMDHGSNIPRPTLYR